MSFRILIITILFGIPFQSWAQDQHEEGLASFYHHRFHGKKSANGEVHDINEAVAAHRTHPFGTYLRVTNLSNMSSTIVCVTDRGPYRKGRIIDVSATVAEELGFKKKGIAKVRVEVVPTNYDLRWLEFLNPKLPYLDISELMPIPTHALTFNP